MSRRGRRRLKGLLISLALLLVVDQVVHLTLLSDGRLRGVRIAPFDPPLFSSGQVATLESLRRIAADREARAPGFDAELGWCPSANTSTDGELYRYDDLAARATAEPFPPERTAGVRRVAALGCSFTRGDEVRGDEAWPALLHAARTDLAVLNLGMGGYGVDQAYLRLRRDALPLDLDEVWVGWLPDASLRVVTQYPPFLRHWTNAMATKPRFVLREGELELLPPAVVELPDFLALFDDQRALLAAFEHDHWLRRAPLAYAPRGSSWTHRFATTRLLLTWHERLERHTAPWVRDPASEVHRILFALFTRMARECDEAGVRFRLLVLPAYFDLESAAAGAPYWSTLTKLLESQGIEVLDLSRALRAAGALTDDSFWMPGGHYGPKANEVIAEAMLSECFPD